MIRHVCKPALLLALLGCLLLPSRRASAVTVTFDAVTCPPSSPPPNCVQSNYTESGMTVVSAQPDGHIHVGDNDGNGSPDVMLHATGNSTPYRFTYSGGAFSLSRFSFVLLGGTHTFTSSSGASVTPAGSGTVTFPAAGWTGITSFTWDDAGTSFSQQGIMDNLEFCPVDCEDGEPCTDDFCDPSNPGADANGCVHQANNNACDDGLFCNGTDTCSAGSCSVHSGDPCANGTECADSCNEAANNCFDLAGAPCTPDTNTCTDDECNGSGTCVHPTRMDGDSCDDGNSCTDNDTCGGGTCSGTPRQVNCDDGNPCTLDGCDPQGGCTHDAGARDGFVCDDSNPCTMQDICQSGVCRGALVEADTDGDGFCDRIENEAGCNPQDPFEIPARPNAYAGAPGNARGEGLIAWAVPTAQLVPITSDPTCAPVGICGPVGFCTAGRIWDPCAQNSDCDPAPNVCRLVANYATVADITFLLQRNSSGTSVSSFMPATMGCSRKVDFTIDPSRLVSRVKIKVKGTIGGRRSRDTDRFKFLNF